MNNLIERYVYDVVRRLPEKVREEVAKELRSNIEDMLSLDPTEKEIKNVLEKLGHPRTLANSYRDKKRFLIGPEWFDDYVLVLKIVMIVFAAIAFVSTVISSVLNPEAATVVGIIFEVIFKTLGEVISSLFQAFAIVTFIFYLIEKYNEKGRTIEFKVLELPKLPDDKAKDISKLGTIISLVLNLVFGFIFVYLLYSGKMIVGWFNTDGEFTILATVFTESVVRPLIPLVILSVVVNTSLDVFKLIEAKWTYRVYVFHSIVKVVTGIISIIFLTSNNLINVDFIDSIAELFSIEADLVSSGIYTGLTVLAVLVGIGTAADIISTWTKQLKQRNPLES